jgi:energy-coupling factor transporter ATP-binding protein EcfA2
MLLGKYVEADINFKELAADISPKTQWGTTKLIDYFKGATEDVSLLEKRRNVILKLRQHFRKTPEDKSRALKLLERAAAVEKALEEKVEIEDERLKEYYAQILWEKDSFASFLNESPMWLEAANLWKVWLLPAVSILIPLIIVVLPYVIIRMTTQADLSVPEYWELLQHILKQQGGQGNMISGMLVPPWVSTGGTTSQVAQRWLQWGLSIFMFGSSIWQQVTLSQHLHTITQDMRKRGGHIWELQSIWKELSGMVGAVIEKYMDLPDNEDLPEDENTLGIFGYTWNKPHVLLGLTKNIGILDVMITCSTLPRIGFPTYVTGLETRLYLENFYHPHLGKEKTVVNTIDLCADKTTHALVTGPNRGGKSTSLKAILANVIMAQSLGFCFARRMKITPFQQIHTALSPSDTLGRLSLFEAEIEFAKEILENLDPIKERGKALLVMDEIFHSTNAIDGEEASRIFLDKVYTASGHASLISTHYTKLPESYEKGKQCQALCLQASPHRENPDQLNYTYKMRKGINSLSSVREILKERGLLSDKTYPS